MSPRLVRAAALAIGLVALLPMATGRLGVLDQRVFPSPRIVESLETGHWFHSVAVGGYLIYADWPEPLVSIDDRAELYGVEGFEEHQRVIDGAYAEFFDRWNISGVIAEHGWPLVEDLLNNGWEIRTRDETFIALSVR